MRLRTIQNISFIAAACLIMGLVLWVLCAPTSEVEIGAFATSLRGRADSQIYNLRLATRAVDGTVLEPGEVFSFNRIVGPWSADAGYKKAPVSYDGELTLSWGGGVCQASSTLYNAALLGGMQIIERHRHYWPASYVAPGRDAGVAYPNIDLRFRNSLLHPVRIVGRLQGDAVVFKLFSRDSPEGHIRIESQVKACIPPANIIQPDAGLPRAKWQTVVKGQSGWEVEIHRVMMEDGTEVKREVISEDYYPPLNEVARVGVRDSD